MPNKPTIDHHSHQDHKDLRDHCDLLSMVEKPSRYLGTEVNRVVKDPSAVDIRLVLAFPDLYEIGTSHFGLQILYHLLNHYDHILAERVFAPASDMETHLRQHQLPLVSLESGLALDRFDIIGFSLLYELNYTNVLNMLDLGRIPLLAADRHQGHPFVIAGGPCVCNPEPMADYFDAMVFGDGEEVILEMTGAWCDWKKSGKPREALLRQWSRLEGVYVPQFFEVSYDERGFQSLTPRISGYTTVRRRIVADLDAAFFPQHPVIPFGRPIHDRLRLEVSRGCTRGCRFCQAGMIYRPVRERSPETLLELCRTGLDATGYEDLSLLSLSTGDYTCLNALMANLMSMCRANHVAVSLPSIRAGTLTASLMEMIRKVRKTGFTIAPEAGSQRLRDVINKNISYDEIAATVEDAFALGWQVIKLYFMIGLPTETQDDIDALVDLVTRLKQIKGPTRRKGRLNISVTTFIPKPHTPFQWASQLTMAGSQNVLEYLKDRLKKSGVHLKWQHPAMSVLEGAMARGDRRMGRVIRKAWELGCLFDGWTDRFRFDLWQKAFDQTDVSLDFFVHRTRDMDEPLPWQHMDARVSAAFLKSQWTAAIAAAPLGDCRRNGCHQCGACDFSLVSPRLFDSCPQPPEPETSSQAPASPSSPRMTVALTYSKLGPGRFFGHLELVNIFARALRRSGITVDYSKGFHPMPRISFGDPLPLGMESQAEEMRLTLKGEGWEKWNRMPDKNLLIDRINTHLPQGLHIVSWRLAGGKAKDPAPSSDTYRITYSAVPDDRLLTDGLKNEIKREEFLAAAHWPHIRTRTKGKPRHLDLRTAVQTMEWIEPGTLEMEIRRGDGFTIRPGEVLQSVFKITPQQLSRLRILKMEPSHDN